MPIVDLLQFCVCCIRSDATKYTRLMMRYQDRMCQCASHEVTWSHIGICAASLQNLAARHRRTFVPLSVALWNDLADPVFDGVRLAGLRAGSMLFYWPKLLYPYYDLLLFSLSLLPVYILVLWGWGLRTDRVYITLSQPCTAVIF